ncbi:hypothetical protein Lal_00033957 [Lupinus albus]|nr:hypothetical protein Lal_00033957 [Lupinus albus]
MIYECLYVVENKLLTFVVDWWGWGKILRFEELAEELAKLPKTHPDTHQGTEKLWSQTNVNYREIPCGDLTGYRSCLDHMNVNDIESDYSLDYAKICHNHQRILMPYIELTNGLIKTQTRQPNMHSGLNIRVIAWIKSYNDLKSNI